MRNSQIKRKLSSGEPALIVCTHFTDPSVQELVSLMGFDGIWLDLEHHTYSLETGAALMRAARGGTSDMLLRCAKGEFMRMGRMLEGGAQGIIYPRCDDAAEAAQVVRWAKFPPLGSRGIDGGNPDMPYCSMPLDRYIREANEQTLIIIQLEEQHAVDNAEAIAAVPGVDVLMFGPGDFTVQSGFAGKFDDPRVQKAMEKIAAAARNTGKHWGLPFGSTEKAKQAMDLGARFIIHGADILILKTGLERIQAEFKQLGFRFENRLA